MVPAAELLTEDFDVHAVDLPGFGLSFKPARALDVRDLARALAAWLAETALAGPVLLANSFGCQVAAELAAERPDLVDRLVLLDPAFRLSPARLLEVARTYGRNDPLPTREAAVAQWRESPLFSEAERVALDYAERMTITGQAVDDALFAQLKRHYNEAQIVELTAAVALENFRSKFNPALGIEAQGFCLIPQR
jgi:pimeloyl-ACP methyl ester carboxylesterase